MEDDPLPPESEAPPSPATDPVRLVDCVEDLLLFTLSSQLAGSLDVDLGLSNDYCSRLLQTDPLPVDSNIGDDCRGVPMYPLYKHLAHSLERSLSSGTFVRVPDSDDELLKMKEDEWSKLLLENGSELMKIFEAVNFELHVQEPFFSQLKAGLKIVEGRCAVGDYNRIAPGASVLFNKALVVEVQHVNRYNSFSEMLQVETLAKVLPGVQTIGEGIQIYRKFYTEEKERTNGVLAICISKPASQPYVHMAKLLTGLGYDGLNFLLGMRHTYGTVPDALPPARSVLIASAMKPFRPNVLP
ncbi:PUA-like protein [Dioscorea alata]|uniref:PUA-like protein n=4 Tax=Dioscorea alata TaxID=55571 RepID=A0ACB7W158_DIOAL|nr:PUA-like protein [Dioscorea alata]KAH7681232.1 PUA-like protein [Dioscorea alata]KAH7681233.1 PUA-like protein [Dioscorea alata]KAH7681235.1 PUA-like protein [Dioscorea alata]